MGESCTIIAVVDELLFQSRLDQQARSLGYRLVVADDAPSLLEALSSDASLLVVDLHVHGVDWREALEKARGARLPVLAFGRHTSAQLLRDARTAGADRVVPRSQLVEELPELLRGLVKPLA